MIVPYAGHFENVGQRALIAWNASRESARAVGDALPLITAAEAVTVLTIAPTRKAGSDIASADDLLEHLACHGIKAQIDSGIAEGISVSDLILSRAADLAADLIVMGAYGHSRMHELLLGDATRELFEHMTVPVLTAH